MVLPLQIIEKYPVVTKVIMEDGSIVPFVSNRFVFGACYSPVITHLALCRKLGWKPTVFDKSKEERPQIAMSDPFKTAFIDDVLIASTEREKSIPRNVVPSKSSANASSPLKRPLITRVYHVLTLQENSMMV